jgi:hypothetical protein
LDSSIVPLLSPCQTPSHDSQLFHRRTASPHPSPPPPPLHGSPAASTRDSARRHSPAHAPRASPAAPPARCVPDAGAARGAGLAPTPTHATISYATGNSAFNLNVFVGHTWLVNERPTDSIQHQIESHLHIPFTRPRRVLSGKEPLPFRADAHGIWRFRAYCYGGG